MCMEQDIILLIVALCSVIIGTVAGFGSSTILLPIALFFVDFKTAIILVSILHISGNISKISIFRQGLNWKILVIFGIPSVALALLGANLIEHIPQDMMKLILGCFLIVFSVSSILKPHITISSSKRNLVAGGSLSGFLAGLIGTGGALRASFLTGLGLEKFTYIATAASIALMTDAIRIPVYLSNGFLEEQNYWYIPILIAIAVCGSLIGKKIIKNLDNSVFRKIVLISLILISLKFIYDGFLFFLSG